MDAPTASTTELYAVYAELARLNRWLGGHDASRFGMDRLARRSGSRSLSVLDVGTGGGDLAPALFRWADRAGFDLDFVGIDDDRAAIDYARKTIRNPKARFEHVNLRDWDDVDRFDIVHMAITLHHFDRPEAEDALRRMAAMARVGVVINDLQRHPVPFYAVQLVTAVRRSPAYVVHDAPLSVNRAFTRDELSMLGRAAGWTEIEVAWRPMFRWVMTGGHR